jgi:hypothetical protein
MDQLTLEDQSREYLLAAATQLQDEINLLKTFKEDLIISSNKLNSIYENLKNSLKEWTREEFSEDNITVEQAQALAEIGDFTITKSYDVTILVEHSFTVELEAGEDVDDVLASVDFSADSYHTTLDNVDYNVREVNYDEID